MKPDPRREQNFWKNATHGVSMRLMGEERSITGKVAWVSTYAIGFVPDDQNNMDFLGRMGLERSKESMIFKRVIALMTPLKDTNTRTGHDRRGPRGSHSAVQ